MSSTQCPPPGGKCNGSGAAGDHHKPGAPLAGAFCAGGVKLGLSIADQGFGPVGARIVAEVLIGLLELDEHSYLGADRNWTPDAEYDSIGKILVSQNASVF